MSHVEMVELNGDEKPVLYFKGKDKGIVLNKTNSNKIAEIFGDDTDGWTDGQIVLFETTTEFQGKTVPAIRVRPAPGRAAPRPAYADRRNEPPPNLGELVNDSISF